MKETRCKSRTRWQLTILAALTCLLVLASSASAHVDPPGSNGTGVGHGVSAFSDANCTSGNELSTVSECTATIYFQAVLFNSTITNNNSFEGGDWDMLLPDGSTVDLGDVPCIGAVNSTNDLNTIANGNRGLCAGSPGVYRSACVPYALNTADLILGQWGAAASYEDYFDHNDSNDTLNESQIVNTAAVAVDLCDGTSSVECTGNEQCVANQCVSPPLTGTDCTDTDGNACTDAVCAAGTCNQANPTNEGGQCTDTDGNECTVAVCTAGTCNQSAAGNEGGDCNDFNGQFDAECADPSCVAGTCQLNAEPDTTTCSPGGEFDAECADPACDGEGQCELNAEQDGTECTTDENSCTDDICLNAICEHPPADPLPAECSGDFTCRSCGFYGNHPAITQQLLDDAEPPISVCGGAAMDTTDAELLGSANEAICVKVKGKQYRQLARQLTCLALSCQFSGGQADALVSRGVTPNVCNGQSTGGQDLEALFDQCNNACATAASGGSSAGVNACIAAVDCINNGGVPVPQNGGYVCTAAEIGQNCHERDLCPDGGTYCFEPPGGAQPGDCKASRSSSCTYADGDCD